VRRIHEEARQFALQCVAAAMLVAWPFDWLNIPAREGGLALGALIGIGNVLRWAKQSSAKNAQS
jgi:hypothetical protein